MLLSPAVIALVVCSALACAVTAVAAGASLSVAAWWDPDDGGARQLARERRMLLVEAVLKVVLACQLASLFLFVATVERLHPLFTGAMCAAGTLGASRFGYPALTAKAAAFLLCGLWLVVHRATAAAAGTALVRLKYLFVLPVLASLAAESVLQVRYFSDLNPEILTSCCATIFGAAAGGIGSDLAALPVGASRTAFFAVLALTLAAGGRALGARPRSGARTVGLGQYVELKARDTGALARNRAQILFAALAVLLGAVSAAAVVTWVAPGFYELPTHHCPFCLLKPELGYVGYPLYLALSLGVVAGAGVGVVRGLRAADPLCAIRPGEERRLCLASMAGFALFALLAAWPMMASDFRLEGS